MISNTISSVSSSSTCFALILGEQAATSTRPDWFEVRAALGVVAGSHLLEGS
jgi:hypothetical protein